VTLLIEILQRHKAPLDVPFQIPNGKTKIHETNLAT
jgi:hypothetical protein